MCKSCFNEHKIRAWSRMNDDRGSSSSLSLPFLVDFHVGHCHCLPSSSVSEGTELILPPLCVAQCLPSRYPVSQ